MERPTPQNPSPHGGQHFPGESIPSAACTPVRAIGDVDVRALCIVIFLTGVIEMNTQRRWKFSSLLQPQVMDVSSPLILPARSVADGLDDSGSSNSSSVSTPSKFAPSHSCSAVLRLPSGGPSLPPTTSGEVGHHCGRGSAFPCHSESYRDGCWEKETGKNPNMCARLVAVSYLTSTPRRPATPLTNVDLRRTLWK